MAASCSYNWTVDRSLYDHSVRFESHFGGRTFSSYDEFQEELKKFEEECLVTFRIRSSVLSVPGDPCVYKRMTLKCMFADFEKASRSVEIRYRRSKNKGCQARFSLNQRDGLLVVGPKGKMLVHNHRCSVMEYRLDPRVRKLTPEQTADVVRFIKYGTPTNRIRLMVRLEYHKYLTRSDINNLKCRMMYTAVPAESWSDFEALVRSSGEFSCTKDQSGRIECLSFCRKEQAELFGRYPEVVCVDATYNVNRSKYCLVQFVITDGLSHGRTVMYSLMRDEKCSTYINAFVDFRNLMPNDEKIRTFMVDMSFAQMSAIRTVFPRTKIMLCHFHMLRAVRRKSKNRLVWHMVKCLMRTRSTTRFNALCLRLRRKFPGFYIYFCRIWLKHAHRWAVCYRSGTICLGNQTNNRAESAHRWLKQDLCAADSLLNCCKRIWVSSHQILVDYVCDVTLSRMRRPLVSFNNPLAGIVHGLTRYAAERILSEWDSSNNPMVVIPVGGDYRVTELVSSRRLRYHVDLRKPRCSCMFFQFYAMPCRHLVFACLKSKVPIGTLLRNTRWLDKYLDGVEPPELVFSPVPLPERKECEEVRLMKRAHHLRQSMSEETHGVMLDRISTVMDAFEITVIDEEPTTGDMELDKIPPLLQRISKSPCTGLSATAQMTNIPPLTTPPAIQRKRAQPSTILTSIHNVPKRRKVSPFRTLFVDLDEEDKENTPIASTSYSSKPG